MGRLPTPTERLGATPDVLLRVECSSGADVLDYTHTFFSAYAEAHFRPQTAQKVTLAAFELLENGLKYGAMTSKVVIELLHGGGWLVVRVTNDAISARVAMLTEHMRRIQTEPEATYLAEMRKSMSGDGKRAMLGLARLTHEASLQVFANATVLSVIVEAACPM